MKKIVRQTILHLFSGCLVYPQRILSTAKKNAASYAKNFMIFLGLLAAMVFFQEAFAGTDGDDFADIYTKLEAWSKGKKAIQLT